MQDQDGQNNNIELIEEDDYDPKMKLERNAEGRKEKGNHREL